MDKGLSLRAFCRKFDLNPGNISKMERNITPAPKDATKLEMYALALGLVKESAEHEQFFLLAEESRGEMMTKGLSPTEILQKLPVFLRNAEGKKPTEEQLDALAAAISSEWTAPSDAV